jgi:hypothetical protein
MPRIPTQDTASVAPVGAPGTFSRIDAGADSFGGQSANALAGDAQQLERGANVLQQHALAFQGMRNETLAKDADTGLMNTLDRIVYDPKGGFATRFGRDAVDGYEGAMKEANEAYKGARDALPNDEAKRMYDGVALRNLQFALRSMSSHAATQNKLWQVESSDARVKTYQDNAANYYNDPQRFNTVLATIRSETRSKGEILGWSPDKVNAEASHQEGMAYVGRIKRVLLEDPIMARTMYTADAERIPADVRPVLEHQIKTAVLPVEARVVADHLLTESALGDVTRAIQTGDGTLLKVLDRQVSEDGGAPDAPLKSRDTRTLLAAVLPKAESIAKKLHPDNPLFLDSVMSVVKGRISTIVQAQEAVQNQAQGQLIQMWVDQKPNSIDELLSRPGARDAWVKLDPAGQRGVIAMAGRGGGDQVKTNPKVFFNLLQRIHADEDDPEKIRNASEVLPYAAHGLAYHDVVNLRNEITQSQTPEGNAFRKSVAEVKQTAARMLRTSMLGSRVRRRLPKRAIASRSSWTRRSSARAPRRRIRASSSRRARRTTCCSPSAS